MTTQSHGSIIYYDSDGGKVLREVTADDVARLEQELAKLSYFVDPHAREALGRWLTADEMIREWSKRAADFDDEIEAMEAANYARAQQLIDILLPVTSADQHTLIDGVVYAATPTIVGVMQRLCYERDTARDDVARLERLAEIAAAIMRSQPVGVPVRLVQEWNEAQGAGQ